MSTSLRDAQDPASSPEEPRSDAWLRALRLFAAASASIALIALWSVERAQLDCDLQLAAPSDAPPGSQIALRALVFCDLDAPTAPRLVTPEVTVRLLDRRERELARVSLTESPLQTLDGALRLPASHADGAVLEATALHEGELLSCRRPLASAEGGEELRGREAGPLQQYALGRVRGDGPAPDRLLPRVVGGACVPELPCRVLLWVGAPAAAVGARGGANVQVRALGPTAETEGLVAFELLVHGPEAELTFEARRGGVLVAERALRVPVALGEVALLGGDSLIEPGAPYTLDVAAAPGRTALSLDAFLDGRWTATRVITAGSEPRPVELAALLPAPPGPVRVQGRSDRFGEEGAGARVLFARAPGLDDASALQALAAWVERQSVGERVGAEAPSWSRELPTFALRDVQASAAFLLAEVEAQRARVPAPVSGRPAQLQQLGRTRIRMRYGVAAALALSALLFALSIARRGLLAVDEAQAILTEARFQEGEGEQEPEPARAASLARVGARAKVLLMVLAVALAFLAGALLIAAKPLWF